MEIKLNTEHITLSQLLKITNISQSGGDAKYLLKTLNVLVNDEHVNRRGKKLFENDIIKINDEIIYLK